jgi:hypothetical protein
VRGIAEEQHQGGRVALPTEAMRIVMTGEKEDAAA